ncbi:MAG TPA: hypothetical protein VK666_05105 [Chryseolinea sp.]|nr:hypothetical protein [Chryseolinea sp.]
MKNILRYTLLLLITVAISCRDEDAVRFPDINTGVNARLILYPERSFINFANLSAASIAFDVYSVNDDIDEIVYTATYVDANDPETVHPPVEAIHVPGSAFVNGKATNVEITAAQLATALGLPGGINDFEGGDNITFTAKAVLNDGRTFDATNSAPSITTGAFASFTPFFTVFVGCPSPVADITSKTYTATIHLEDSNGGPPFDLVDESTRTGVTITFVGPEPFRYRVSSHDAGWWAIPDVGDTEGGPADFFDICSTIVMQPKPSFGFGGANDDGGGTYDPATGIITMNWYNAANDIFGFVTYTPE